MTHINYLQIVGSFFANPPIFKWYFNWHQITWKIRSLSRTLDNQVSWPWNCWDFQFAQTPPCWAKMPLWPRPTSSLRWIDCQNNINCRDEPIKPLFLIMKCSPKSSNVLSCPPLSVIFRRYTPSHVKTIQRNKFFSNWIVCVCYCLFPNNICYNHTHTFPAQSNQSNKKKKHMACRLPVIFDPFSHQGRERAREGERPRCPWLGFDTQVSTTRFARESSEWRLWVEGWGEWEINTPHVSVRSD